MKIGICDDRMTDAERAKEILCTCLKKEAGEWSIDCISPEDLLWDLEEQKFDYDMMVMDIDLENESYNGISLSKRINEQNSLCQIIYLTDYLEFAPDVYETEHCYFVLKKNMDVMLFPAFEKAKKLLDQMGREQVLELTSDGVKQYVKVSEIHYIEKEERRLHICTENGELFSYDSLRKVAAKSKGQLVRCHGSYLVNLRYIERYEKDAFLLAGGVRVPIGRSYQTQTKKSYMDYWADRI